LVSHSMCNTWPGCPVLSGNRGKRGSLMKRPRGIGQPVNRPTELYAGTNSTKPAASPRGRMLVITG
jgi:hypothetical protein